MAQELARGRIDSKTGKDLNLPLQNVCSLLLTPSSRGSHSFCLKSQGSERNTATALSCEQSSNSVGARSLSGPCMWLVSVKSTGFSGGSASDFTLKTALGFTALQLKFVTVSDCGCVRFTGPNSTC